MKYWPLSGLADWGLFKMASNAEEAYVPLGLFKRYLTLRGWRSTEIPSSSIALYVLSDSHNDDIEIALPRTADSPDANRRIEAAIRTLSQLEQRVFSTVVEDVCSIGFDRVKSIIPDASVRYDTIDLDLARNFIQGAKRLFVASATTEISPAPFFGRVRKEAQEYSNRCRFGHTFRGSFGFTIESPISANDEPTLLPDEQIPPFERRVVQRLIRGFQLIERAEQDEDVSVITDGFRSGFNANMCEDFAELIENTTDEIKFQVVWSPEWKPPLDVISSSTFEVRHNTLQIVSEAARSLRRQETNLARTVSGRVIRLRSDRDPSDLLDTTVPREINLIWENDEFGSLNVRVVLDPSDYIKAVEAHKSGKRVSVRGLLERVGRSWFLSQPSEFAVVE